MKRSNANTQELVSRHDENGREHLDQTPLALPVYFRRPPTIQEQIKRFVRQELSAQADEAGEETFEEADDFDIPEEDPEWVSQYELHEMQLEAVIPKDADQRALDVSPAERVSDPVEAPAVAPGAAGALAAELVASPASSPKHKSPT